MELLLHTESISSKILFIRNQYVLLDRDLAELYGVITSQLTRQTRRNIERFPDDFMFTLTKEELTNLKSHIGTSSWGGTRKSPLVFTEQGIAMLSGLLNSPKAIQVNIAIMRTFTKLRQMYVGQIEMRQLISKLESTQIKHGEAIHILFEAIDQLMSPAESPVKKIGFR